MFDRTVVLPTRTRTEFVTREVHEHRAPTDESVKLLREMETKAREQVTQATHVFDTAIDCVVEQLREPYHDKVRMAAVFSLNGRKMRVDVALPSHEAKELPIKLRDAMAEKIATEVLLPAFSKANL